MNFVKIRSSHNIQIAWRLRPVFVECQPSRLAQNVPACFRLIPSGPKNFSARLHSENGSAGTQLVPVRPCAITAGSVSIQAGQVLQIL